MSLRFIAAALGRHHSVIGKMEQDRRMIEIVEFIRYCREVGADPHEGLEVVIQSLKREDVNLS